MGQANIIHARAPLAAEPRAVRSAGTVVSAGAVALTLHEDLASAAADWRALEQSGECTPFQSFAWASAWQRHIGARCGTRPAIIVGRRGSDLLFVLPLAVEPGGLARRLTFLGQDLCDYNAPLLARDVMWKLAPDAFVALWRESLALIQSRRNLRHDMVVLQKMPRRIGTQPNPMLALDVRLHPSGAYETALGANWEAFYNEKRSSATRRRDRTKLKKLGELGKVAFVEQPEDLAATLERLIEQKGKAFARMGVANMFARPGYPEFFRDVALSSRALVHLSRLDVGDTWAAINLGLTFRDGYYHILASYDDGEASRFGPGAAHLRELLHYAIRRGLTRFDFTIGDEPYKRDWCETEQQLFDHSAAVTLRGVPPAAAALAWGRAKRAIKHSALLWGLVQRLRALKAGWRKAPDSATD